MEIYERIEIKKVPRTVGQKLKEQAKLKQMTRPDYLIQVFEKLSKMEMELEADLKYEKILDGFKIVFEKLSEAVNQAEQNHLDNIEFQKQAVKRLNRIKMNVEYAKKFHGGNS